MGYIQHMGGYIVQCTNTLILVNKRSEPPLFNGLAICLRTEKLLVSLCNTKIIKLITEIDKSFLKIINYIIRIGNGEGGRGGGVEPKAHVILSFPYLRSTLSV